ncbi:MAG: ATP-dependent DNA ligase [Sporichthyaceae bacterium]
MDLPVMPPVAPMLAKAASAIPVGDYSYEPKWDGFRAVVFRDGDEIEIGSRSTKSLTRYFPEVVDALRDQCPPRCVLDGEIVIPDAAGTRLDFEALLQRIHPAERRVRLLASSTPARFVAFDVLALGDADLTGQPFATRRARLVEALAAVVAPVHLTPATQDPGLAGEWFALFEGAGLDGVVAKAMAGTYQQDKRAMIKVKHDRTADCVVAGYRVHKSGPDTVGSLLLGLYDTGGRLASVGVVGALSMAMRRELFALLQEFVCEWEGHPWAWAEQETGTRTPREAEGSRWNAKKDLGFTPLRPELVLEVRYDHMEGVRFRHTAQFVRWRPDRDPVTCTYSQLAEPVSFNLAEVFTGRL